MKLTQRQQSRWQARVRIAGFIVALLILIAGAVILALNSGHSLPAIILTIFGALGVIFAFLQLWPIIFQPKPQQPESEPAPAPQSPSINIYNVLPGAQPAQMTDMPASPDTHLPPVDSPQPASDALTLRAQSMPTGEKHIQQRSAVVKEVYDMLIASDAAAVALCGIGGIGKSTLAALVCEHAERERRAGRAPFHDEAILLRINENTTFLELATNIFAATGNPMPDFSGLPVQNQAFAIFNALDTASLSRLIILDQFENFLDEQSGKPLPTSVGIGELLDALNSQPRSSRILLTSRARPRGTRDDNPTALSVYRVGGLNEQEGVAYLCSYGVKATEADLREAVKRCQGHALSLRLIHTLLQTYTISLAILLHNSDYRQLWNGKIAENLLDRIFNNLPLPSQQLLCAFSVYREAVPVEAALAIHDMSRELAFKCLENLLLQHLIQGKDGAYQLHPIVSDYAYDHFARRVKHVS